MERRYVIAMLRVDHFHTYNFVNGKKSKEKLAKKRWAPVDVIQNARQLGKRERIKIVAHDIVEIELVYEGGNDDTTTYQGNHIIYVYSDKIIME